MIPVSDKFNDYAAQVHEQLLDAGLRAEANLKDDRVGYKIREASLQKIPYAIVVGEREQARRARSTCARATRASSARRRSTPSWRGSREENVPGGTARRAGRHGVLNLLEVPPCPAPLRPEESPTRCSRPRARCASASTSTRPVPRDVILDCIRLSQQAPTGSNAQSWRWLVVTDAEARRSSRASTARAARSTSSMARTRVAERRRRRRGASTTRPSG